MGHEWLFYVIIIVLVGGFAALIGFGARKEIRAQYDERQLIAQGRGYKWGFLSMLLGGTVYAIADSFMQTPILTPTELIFAVMCLGAGVMAVYDILKDAYIPLNRGGSFFVYIFPIVFGGLEISRAVEYIKYRHLLYDPSLWHLTPHAAAIAMCLAILVSEAVRDITRARGSE